MPAVQTCKYRKLLLAAMPVADLARLSEGFEAVSLPRRTSLEHPNRKIENVYFMETGITSVVATTSPGGQVEVGIIGREGMTGLAVVLLNDRFPYSAYIQVEATAQRVSADAVRAAMKRSIDCHRIFLGFAQAFLVQTSETAISNAHATLEERLARWLLMAQDRVEADDIPLTHEFLSMMMGARRPGVTEAIHALTRKNLIVGKRAVITITDRAGLEARAGRYYGVAEKEQQRLLNEGKQLAASTAPSKVSA